MPKQLLVGYDAPAETLLVAARRRSPLLVGVARARRRCCGAPPARRPARARATTRPCARRRSSPRRSRCRRSPRSPARTTSSPATSSRSLPLGAALAGAGLARPRGAGRARRPAALAARAACSGSSRSSASRVDPRSQRDDWRGAVARARHAPGEPRLVVATPASALAPLRYYLPRRAAARRRRRSTTAEIDYIALPERGPGERPRAAAAAPRRRAGRRASRSPAAPTARRSPSCACAPAAPAAGRAPSSRSPPGSTARRRAARCVVHALSRANVDAPVMFTVRCAFMARSARDARLRLDRRRVGLRRQRLRAPADREGLPRRRLRVRPALRRPRVPEVDVGPAALLLRAAPRACTGSSACRSSRTSRSSAARASAAAASATPTRCTARGRASTRTRSGRASRTTGRPRSRRTSTRPSGCSASRPSRPTTRPTTLLRAFGEHIGAQETLRQDPRRRLLRRARRDRRRPLLRRRGPAAHGLHRLRALHGRLPDRREEHAAEELPLARRARAARRSSPERTVVDVRPLGARRRLRRLRGRHRAHRRLAAQGPPHAHGRARSCSPAARSGTNKLLQRCVPQRLAAERLARASASSCARTARRSSPSPRKDDSVDYTKRVAISGSIYPDENTHIETVSYGHAGDGDEPAAHAARRRRHEAHAAAEVPRGRAAPPDRRSPRLFDPRGWSRRTIILLVMQTLDNAIALRPRPGRRGAMRLQTEQDPRQARRRRSSRSPTRPRSGSPSEIGGVPQSSLMEALASIPTTAHILGGVVIAPLARGGRRRRAPPRLRLREPARLRRLGRARRTSASTRA